MVEEDFRWFRGKEEGAGGGTEVEVQDEVSGGVVRVEGGVEVKMVLAFQGSQRRRRLRSQRSGGEDEEPAEKEVEEKEEEE